MFDYLFCSSILNNHQCAESNGLLWTMSWYTLINNALWTSRVSRERLISAPVMTSRKWRFSQIHQFQNVATLVTGILVGYFQASEFHPGIEKSCKGCSGEQCQLCRSDAQRIANCCDDHYHSVDPPQMCKDSWLTRWDMMITVSEYLRKTQRCITFGHAETCSMVIFKRFFQNLVDLPTSGFQGRSCNQLFWHEVPWL